MPPTDIRVFWTISFHYYLLYWPTVGTVANLALFRNLRGSFYTPWPVWLLTLGRDVSAPHACRFFAFLLCLFLLMSPCHRVLFHQYFESLVLRSTLVIDFVFRSGTDWKGSHVRQHLQATCASALVLYTSLDVIRRSSSSTYNTRFVFSLYVLVNFGPTSVLLARRLSYLTVLQVWGKTSVMDASWSTLVNMHLKPETPFSGPTTSGHLGTIDCGC